MTPLKTTVKLNQWDGSWKKKTLLRLEVVSESKQKGLKIVKPNENICLNS